MKFGGSAIPTPLGRSAASSPSCGVPPTRGFLQSRRSHRIPVPGPSARAVSFVMVCPAAKRSCEAQTYLDQLGQVDTRVVFWIC